MINKKTCIALIGFMATGKSTIGPLLAKQLDYTFVDTDDLVESNMKMKISDIFSELGEAVFRDAEHKALKEALEMENIVLSTGGGIVLSEGNRRLLKEKAFIVSLTAQPETIFNRIKGDETRPLLKSDDPLKRINEMMGERQKYYKECDFEISTEEWIELECCEKVAEAYQKEFG